MNRIPSVNAGGTIGYEDERLMPTRAAYMQTSRAEGVLSPVPIIVTNVPGESDSVSQQCFEPIRPHPNSGNGEADAWMFTKPKQMTETRVQYLRDPTVDRKDDKSHKPVTLYLSRSDVSKIHKGRDQFHAHLKNLSHEPVGKFNPISIMDWIADDIYGDCLKEVCKELEEINTDIASHVYSGEFAHIPKGTGVEPQ